MNTAVAFLLIIFVLQTLADGALKNYEFSAADLDRTFCIMCATGWLSINLYYIITIAWYLRTVRIMLGDEINVKSNGRSGVEMGSDTHVAQEVGMGLLVSQREYHVS